VTNAAALSPDGSAYLAGFTRSFSSSPERIAAFVVKFGAEGALDWQRTWLRPEPFGSDESRDIAVAAGGVYVTGVTQGTAGDVLLLKFDLSGALVWQKTWGGTGTESGDGIAVGSDGSIYVTGASNSFGSTEALFILKLTPNGSLVWQQTWSTSSGATADGIAVAPDGSVYVAGGAPRSGATFGFDILVLKLDAAGHLVWQRAHTAGEIVDTRGSVTVAPDGSVYVAGTLPESTRKVVMDAIMLKFAPDGSPVWDRSWGGRNGEEAGAVAVAGDGTILLSGSTASFGVAPDDAFLVQLMPDTATLPTPRCQAGWVGL
jgi:uncharacterized delta-60 repeat protein